MFKIITIIYSLISWCFNLFKKGNSDEERLKYDRLLADAIRRGDAEEVARIREKWKHYAIIIVLVMALSASGCGIFRPAYKNIPLTGGMLPYELKTPAVYEDSKGVLHQEDSPRWSLSQEDLFRDTQQIAEKASQSPVTTTIDKIGTYTEKATPYIIILLLLFIVVKRK